jgi:biotin carboxylase
MTVPAAPTVLLIGSDRAALRACERLGVRAVLLYGGSTRDEGLMPRFDGLTPVFVDDMRGADSVLAALHRAGLGGTRFDGVVPGNEYTLVLGGLLAGLLGCRGLDPLVTLAFRDKYLQKQRVRAAGLPAARQLLIEDIRDLGALPELPAARAVLKPVAGAGTALTTVVDSPAALRAAAGAARRERNRTFVLEEFIEGDEWLVDGVLSGGELAFYSVARYGRPCLATIASQAPLTFRRFDPGADAAVFDEAGQAARAALAALGMLDGVFHMELFKPPGGGPLVFGECAARRGAALVQEEVLCKFRVDLAEEAVRAAIGWQPRLDVKVAPETVGTTYLTGRPGRPGVLVSCPPASEVRARPGARYARIEEPPGSVIGALDSTSSRIGQVMMTAASPAELESRLAEINAWFGDRVIVVPRGATKAELRAWQGESWPGSETQDAPAYDPEAPGMKEQHA